MTKKSAAITRTEPATTATVVDLPTPAVPPLVRMPTWQATVTMMKPNTNGFDEPHAVDVLHVEAVHAPTTSTRPLFTCSWNLATTHPPVMPTASEMTVRMGVIRKPATIRGTTSFPDRISAERAQRVDLVGHHHRPEFCGDARADASDQHQRRQHRSQFLDHRRADEPANHRARAELIERQTALRRDGHPGEQPGQQDHGERADADQVELLDDVVAIDGRRDDAAPARHDKAHVLLRLQGGALQPVFDKRWHTVSLSAPATAARDRHCAGA